MFRLPKFKVLNLFFIGFVFYIPILILQYVLAYFGTEGFSFIDRQIKLVPSSDASQDITKLFQEYQSYIFFILLTRIGTYVYPLFTVFIFIFCFIFMCCRCSVSRQRYLSITSIANPFAIMVSVYHRYEYNPTCWESWTKNKNFGIFLIGIYILSFSGFSLASIGLQCREMYLNQHDLADFYELNSKLITQIQYDAAHHSVYNSCKVNEFDESDKRELKPIYSPYCEVTAEYLLKNLETDKKFYDSYVLRNDYSSKDVGYVIVKFTYGLYSGLSTFITIIGYIIFGSCAIGYYMHENGQYIPYTVYGRRKQVLPINQNFERSGFI